MRGKAAMIRAFLVAYAAVLALLELLLAWPVRAEPVAPPGTLQLAPIGALCGPLATHLALLGRAGFEGSWRGGNAIGDAAFVVTNDDGFWVLLVTFASRPDEACVVGSGERFEYR